MPDAPPMPEPEVVPMPVEMARKEVALRIRLIGSETLAQKIAQDVLNLCYAYDNRIRQERERAERAEGDKAKSDENAMCMHATWRHFKALADNLSVKARAFTDCAFAGAYDDDDALIKAKHMSKLYALEEAISAYRHQAGPPESELKARADKLAEAVERIQERALEGALGEMDARCACSDIETEAREALAAYRAGGGEA